MCTRCERHVARIEHVKRLMLNTLSGSAKWLSSWYAINASKPGCFIFSSDLRLLRAIPPSVQFRHRAPSSRANVCVVHCGRCGKRAGRRLVGECMHLHRVHSCGQIVACLGNPLFLIKARMQAYSPALPVGAQHYYRNSFAALKEIFKAEGLRGYIRGMDAAILRTCMGSSASSCLDAHIIALTPIT